MDEKLDSLQLEWTYSLTSQLEQQKQYFEEKINRLQHQSAEKSELRQKLNKLTEDNKKLLTEKTALEKKINHLSTRLTTTLSQMQDEKEMTKALQSNQKEWQERCAQLEKELKDKQLVSKQKHKILITQTKNY